MSERPSKILHYFSPHESNNQRARILHPSFLSVLVAVFLTSQFFLNYFSLYFPQILGYAANISPEKLIELTNQQRTKKGISALENNPVLNEAARRKASDMFALDYWAHNSPTGRTPWAFIKEAGYAYIFAGENLARDFDNSSSVVTAWMNSPTHRDNILNQNYKEIGIAVVDGELEGIKTTLVVQMFGTPTPVRPVARKKEIIKETEEKVLPVAKPALASGFATSSAWLSDLIASANLNEAEGAQNLVSPFSITKAIVVFLSGLVMGALILDLILVARKRVVRLTGRSLAHLTFLFFILLGVIATQQGAIL